LNKARNLPSCSTSKMETGNDDNGGDFKNEAIIGSASQNTMEAGNAGLDVGYANYTEDCEDCGDETTESLMFPLVTTSPQVSSDSVRSRKRSSGDDQNKSSRRNPARRKEKLKKCCDEVMKFHLGVLRNTISVMNFLARILFWCSLAALAGAVIWYSRELAYYGTDPHLIAWFSAGAFVILGFPISIYGILMHLSNYYQPNVQCYVVRILWMVPIYSIESWLCLRFKEYAIYIETLRDVYESFVLYCFLQFLIEVLGGEEALILMLKDKSPTRGFHYVPMNWCLKPWVMGQPVSLTGKEHMAAADKTSPTKKRPVRWTSPFFIKCKFGCLQYVLLKFVSSIFVMVLEVNDLYKEGDFTIQGGYLYICILTNTSQCWALYCLVIFYYATKNELGPIRPVGKFLSVKALVFFTWWQSLGIAILVKMGLIPNYETGGWTSDDVAKGLQAYLICIEMFIGAIVHMFVFPHTDYMKPLAVSRSVSVGATSFGLGRRLGRRRAWKDDSKSVGSKTSNIDYDESISGHLEDDVLSSPSVQNFDGTIENGINSNVELTRTLPTEQQRQQHERKGFTSALIDSFVPMDVMDNTVGIARGDFTVEKKTLLYHAAETDEYALFAKRRAMQRCKEGSK